MRKRSVKHKVPLETPTVKMKKNLTKLQKLYADRNADARPNFCQGPKCSKSSMTTSIFQVDQYQFCTECSERYKAAKESKRHKQRLSEEAKARIGWGEW